MALDVLFSKAAVEPQMAELESLPGINSTLPSRGCE